MVSTERTTTQEKMGQLIVEMSSKGYTYVREKRRNADGTIVLEFNYKATDNRQMLME